MLDWLSGSALAHALIANPTLYIFANAAHILSIGLLVGSVVPLDLRLIGLVRGPGLGELGPFLSRAAMAGAAMSVATGAILFTVNAREYAANPAFLAKLGIVAAGLANAAMLHASPAWRHALQTGTAPASVRIAAGLSMLLWICALLAGRWIGFL